MEVVKLTRGNWEEIIDWAVSVLKRGGVIVYPTETCYGIGVDPTNQEAVDKLISYKTHRNDKAISIACSDQEMAEKFVELNSTAKNLYKEYLPGPFTIVSKSKGKVANFVESNRKTLGIRIPGYGFVVELIKKFEGPITSTSANVSYKKTPYEIKDILENTSWRQQELIDLVIDAGKLPKNDPSTVIDTSLEDINVLRQGDIVIDKEHKVITHSELESRDFGGKLVSSLVKRDIKKPIVICMQGELGTGKTQITKGIASFLEVKQEVISPTYIICREYKVDGKVKMLFHIDAYRLFEAKELLEIGFMDMLSDGNIVVIEWAEKVSGIINELGDKIHLVWMRLYHKSENERIIEYGEKK